jgi:predicted restriction endonuclease
MLVAAHIVPWTLDSKNRLNPRNGILLCKTHDAAFEADIMRILPDYTVKLVVTKTDALGAHLARFLQEHTATKLRSPNNKAHAPSPDFLKWRLSKNKAEQVA